MSFSGCASLLLCQITVILFLQDFKSMNLQVHGIFKLKSVFTSLGILPSAPGNGFSKCWYLTVAVKAKLLPLPAFC